MTPSQLGLGSCQITPERQHTHGASRRSNCDRRPQFVARAWQHQIRVRGHQPVSLSCVATRRGADRDLIEQVPLRPVVQEQVYQCRNRRRSALDVYAQDPGASRHTNNQVVDRAGAISGGVCRAERQAPDARC